MKKRGIAEVPMKAILAVIFLLVLGTILQAGQELVRDENEIEMCQLSLFTNDKVRRGELLGVETKERIPINCPKKTVTIGMNDLSLGRKGEREDALKFLLAEQLRTCKRKTSFEDIELKPFDVDYFDTRTRFCIYCSEIEFEDDVKNKIPKIDGFIWFLSRQKMDDGRTYLEYLTGIKDLTGEDYQKMKEEGFVDIIETKDNYATVHAIEKSGYLWQSLDAIAGGTGVGIIGCKVGAAATVIPGIGWGIAGIVCGSSIVGGTLWGYHLGEGFTDEVISYSFVKEKNVENLACDSLYR